MKLIELLTRTLCDTGPGTTADGAFFFSQTKDNQKSVFLTARRIVDKSLARKIFFLETSAKSGYPGYISWKQGLYDQGISEGNIEGVETIDVPTLNTLVESQALIRFAKRKGHTSILVVASPFHQLRAFMTAVTVALREYPQLLIYSQTGAALSWSEIVYHSQGSATGTRSELIASELARIDKYQRKGDLASFDEVLAYLNTRDTITQ